MSIARYCCHGLRYLQPDEITDEIKGIGEWKTDMDRGEEQ